MPLSLNQKVKNFFSKFPKKNFKKRVILISAGETPSNAYYLKEGYVREYALSQQGVELTLHIFRPGSYFPLTAIISRSKNRYFFEAITPLEVHLIPKDKVVEFLKKEPDVSLDLSRRLLMGLDKLVFRIEHLISCNARLKILSAILYLSKHFGKVRNKSVSLTEVFTHRDIASFAGITRETASRELEKFEKEKIIRYDKHKITINNLDMVKKMIDTISIIS